VFNTSRKTLINISAVVWVVSAIILLIKGMLLLKAAHIISESITIISVVVISALLIGLLKSKLVMIKFCRKNISRINNIAKPKMYQFFEIKFLIFLALMILTGITLSRFAAGDYSFLLAIGGLDFALSTALFSSSMVFFNIEQSIRK